MKRPRILINLNFKIQDFLNVIKTMTSMKKYQKMKLVKSWLNWREMENKIEFAALIAQMKKAQDQIFQLHGINDIFTSSKIFEILIASGLDHEVIPGQAGTADATDPENRSMQFEYKHFKELSSNHSWTFNDYSDSVIAKIDSKINSVFFCHIDDRTFPPVLDWYYELSGSEVAEYLRVKTPSIKNKRKMINVSEKQLNEFFGEKGTLQRVDIKIDRDNPFPGKYAKELEAIFTSIKALEDSLGLKNLLTSSKLWELIVAVEIDHFVNSEQGGRSGAHDAFDSNGSWFEYKVEQTVGWSFQDISDAVLDKYLELEAFILAVVDKPNFKVTEIYRVETIPLINAIRHKRDQKAIDYEARGKEVRRDQVTVGKRELDLLKAQRIL